MGTLWQDVRYGVRTLAKAPGFAAIAILTLALGIGANTAIFSVVYGVLLRPLPYPQPGQITQFAISYKGQLDYSNFTAREFDFWKQHGEPFAAIAATTGEGFNLTGGSESMRVRALRVSSSYFDVMGVQPELGRNFSAAEDSAGGPNVAILSYGVWKSEFGGSPQIVGKNVTLGGAAYTVVGVMPRGFQSIPAVDVWTTIAQVNRSTGSGTNYTLLARLKTGTTREQADAYVRAASVAFFQQFRTHQIGVNQRANVAVHPEPLVAMLAFTYRGPLIALFGAIGFVLLIACVNVANLMLSRAAAREREMAIRVALGAGRMRIGRQVLTENLLLALAGGALGIVLAYWGLNLLLALAPTDLPRASDIAINGWALGFATLVAVGCGIFFGLAPAFQALRTDLIESLKESAGRASAGLARQRMRGMLVVMEIALSVVLLAGASLLIETFANLLRVNPGFNPHPLLSVEMWPSGGEFKSTADMVTFDRALIQRIERIPGVQSAAIVTGGLPLEMGGNEYFTFVGQKRDGISADYREITPDYFKTLGVPLEQGRLFTDADDSTRRTVAIVNEEMAKGYFPNGRAVGQHVKLEGTTDLEIVGVVGDVRSFIGEPAQPTVFIPDAQSDIGATEGFLSWFPGDILVRTAQEPLGVSKNVVGAVHAVDAGVPVGHVEPMEEILSTSLAFQEFLMTLMSIFAGLALVLAAVGIYGVMAYSVAQRTHEIGIRMALGARPGDVWRMVIARGFLLAAIGVGVGLAGAIGLTRFLADQLFGVTPADPVILAVAGVALALVALLACWIPARRATRVDPLVALRYE